MDELEDAAMEAAEAEEAHRRKKGRRSQPEGKMQWQQAERQEVSPSIRVRYSK